MLLTEEEAKTKWCPFSRVINSSGEGGGNRWDGMEAGIANPKTIRHLVGTVINELSVIGKIAMEGKP